MLRISELKDKTNIEVLNEMERLSGLVVQSLYFNMFVWIKCQSIKPQYNFYIFVKFLCLVGQEENIDYDNFDGEH